MMMRTRAIVYFAIFLKLSMKFYPEKPTAYVYLCSPGSLVVCRKKRETRVEAAPPPSYSWLSSPITTWRKTTLFLKCFSRKNYIPATQRRRRTYACLCVRNTKEKHYYKHWLFLRKMGGGGKKYKGQKLRGKN